MKYLVIQSYVGSGTWWSDNVDLQHLYDDVLIPSFAAYCKKHGYQHVVYRDQNDLIDLVNVKSKSNWGNLYHSYLSVLKHVDDDVDYVVFPDADYYVTEKALPFPGTSCVSGKIWTEDEVKQWGRGKDPETFTTVYGGIQIMKLEAAISHAEYIKSRMTDYLLNDSPMTLMPNEITMGEWMLKYHIQPENLSLHYNRILDDITDRKWTPEDSQAGFWHFVGLDKAEKFNYVLKNAGKFKAMTQRFMAELERDGLTISDQVFDVDDLRVLNNIVSKLPPFIGHGNGRWLDNEDVLKQDHINWAYNWSVTPTDNTFINETMLPLLEEVCDSVFEGQEWGWQMTNRYVMSNHRHEADLHPHLDAPYLWPQKLDCVMAKYLPKGILSVTFMIPLIDFTPENGATSFIPGSHKYLYETTDWNESRPYRDTFFKDNYVQPSVPLGSFSCFYGNTLHSVMPNRTDDVRRGIIFRGIRKDALEEMSRLGLG